MCPAVKHPAAVHASTLTSRESRGRKGVGRDGYLSSERGAADAQNRAGCCTIFHVIHGASTLNHGSPVNSSHRQPAPARLRLGPCFVAQQLYTSTMRQLKYHEQKLLKKVDFLQWKSDQNIREIQVREKEARETIEARGLCYWLTLGRGGTAVQYVTHHIIR